MALPVDIFAFPRLVWGKRRLVAAMTQREVKSQYAGSFLGLFWAFIHPLIMIGVFWFVFSVGFKAKPMNDVPFVVWLTAGMAPWFLFSNIVSGATPAVVGHSHLIKKTLFSSELLPVIKICANLVTHVFFVLILVGLMAFQGMALTFWALQSLYYLLCLIVLSLGISWFTSSLFVFVRDVGQLVSVALQVGFWVTPIFWDIRLMSPKIQMILQLNPVYYIIQGYRDSFIAGIPFWQHPIYSLYFWCITGGLLLAGSFVFKRLAGQFSDVL